MHQIFAKYFSSKTKAYCTLILLLICCFGCETNNLKKSLEIDCNKKNSFQNLHKIRDTKETFSCELPNNWKREFFLDNYTSRLYAADTTKELDDAYIFDFGHYQSKIDFNKEFDSKITHEITQLPKGKISNSGKITFKKKEAYFVRYSFESMDITSNNIQVYFKNQNKSFYKLKIDVYGNKNIENRLCKALDLFNKTSLNE